MSLKTLLFTIGALALAACASPTEPRTADAPDMLVRPPLPTARPSRIVFVRDEAIYSMNPDGSGIFPVTHNTGHNDQPALSPDGSKIVFTNGYATANNRDIYVINWDGSGVFLLTSSPYDDVTPSWSPNGSKIAFASNRDGNYEIYVMNADGTRIACSAGAKAPSLRQSCRLTNNASSDVAPAWSPDGSKIAFTSDRDDGSGDIYVMNATNGSMIARLTTYAGYDGAPAWSPDGSKIAFASKSGGWGYREIYVMNATDGSGKVRLTLDLSDDLAPTWSPDGSQIAFASNFDGADTWRGEIYVMNADGGGKVRLTTYEGPDSEPSWGFAPFTSAP